jgi:hypothetical protein
MLFFSIETICVLIINFSKMFEKSEGKDIVHNTKHILYSVSDKVFIVTVLNVCGKMPNSTDAPSVTCYKSNTIIHNEIPHLLNTCQKFPSSDILLHFLLHLLILASRTWFPTMYIILCHLINIV